MMKMKGRIQIPVLQKQSTKTGAKGANLTAVTRDWAKAGDWCQ